MTATNCFVLLGEGFWIGGMLGLLVGAWWGVRQDIKGRGSR